MTEGKSSERYLLTAIIVSMILWGLSWPSGKVLTNYLSPVNFVVCRYIIVVLTLYPLLLLLKVPLSGRKEGIPYIIASGFLLALYSYLFVRGLEFGMAGAGGVLVTTLNPIIAYSIGIVINKRKPSRVEFYGLLTGLIAGCILLKIWNEADELFDSGNLFFLAASFTWAVMSVFTSKAKVFGTSFSFSLWQYIATLSFIFPFVNFTELKSVINIDDSIFWINLFFSSAVVTTLATTVYFYATSKVGPEKASSYIFLVPMGAEISSWLLLKEPILIHTVIGGLIGILAVYIINWESLSFLRKR